MITSGKFAHLMIQNRHITLMLSLVYFNLNYSGAKSPPIRWNTTVWPYFRWGMMRNKYIFDSAWIVPWMTHLKFVSFKESFPTWESHIFFFTTKVIKYKTVIIKTTNIVLSNPHQNPKLNPCRTWRVYWLVRKLTYSACTYCPLQNYWKSMANSLIFAVHW